MSGNHNMYCSGNQPSLVERLRQGYGDSYLEKEAADEIESLREQLAAEKHEADKYYRQNQEMRGQLATVTLDKQRELSPDPRQS